MAAGGAAARRRRRRCRRRTSRAFEGERERAEAAELAERFARRMRARLTRRERARRSGRRLDLRSTIRHSVAHGGEPIELKFRRRKPKPLRLVVLLDASGSMEPYTAFFTRFVHAVSLSFRESEAFLFHTRLAHVSSALRERDPSRALDRLALMAAGRRRRHQDRRMPGRVQPLACAAGHPFAHLRDDPVRRLRHRRAGVAGGGDAGSQAAVQTHRLAQSAARRGRLTSRAREGCRPPCRSWICSLPRTIIESLAALEPYLARI